MDVQDVEDVEDNKIESPSPNAVTTRNIITLTPTPEVDIIDLTKEDEKDEVTVIRCTTTVRKVSLTLGDDVQLEQGQASTDTRASNILGGEDDIDWSTDEEKSETVATSNNKVDEEKIQEQSKGEERTETPPPILMQIPEIIPDAQWRVPSPIMPPLVLELLEPPPVFDDEDEDLHLNYTPMPKRRRTLFTKEQTDELNKVYERNGHGYPDVLDKTHLVDATGLSLRQIRYWFYKERLKRARNSPPYTIPINKGRAPVASTSFSSNVESTTASRIEARKNVSCSFLDIEHTLPKCSDNVNLLYKFYANENSMNLRMVLLRESARIKETCCELPFSEENIQFMDNWRRDVLEEKKSNYDKLDESQCIAVDLQVIKVWLPLLVYSEWFGMKMTGTIRDFTYQSLTRGIYSKSGDFQIPKLLRRYQLQKQR